MGWGCSMRAGRRCAQAAVVLYVGGGREAFYARSEVFYAGGVAFYAGGRGCFARAWTRCTQAGVCHVGRRHSMRVWRCFMRAGRRFVRTGRGGVLCGREGVFFGTQ